MILMMKNKYKRVGVVVADDMEFKPLFDFFIKQGGRERLLFSRKCIDFTLNKTEFTAVFCGIGKVNAAALTAALISEGCDCIMNYGLSGGLKEGGIGGFVVPDRFVEHDFDLTPLGYKICEKPFQKYIYRADESVIKILLDLIPNALCGTAVCGDRFITKKEDVDFFVGQFDAVSCDMETAAIASVCDMTNTPFFCLRRISDGADENVQSYLDMNINSGDILFDNFYRIMNYIS